MRKNLIKHFITDNWKALLLLLVIFAAYSLVLVYVGAEYGDWKASKRVSHFKPCK